VVFFFLRWLLLQPVRFTAFPAAPSARRKVCCQKFAAIGCEVGDPCPSDLPTTAPDNFPRFPAQLHTLCCRSYKLAYFASAEYLKAFGENFISVAVAAVVAVNMHAHTTPLRRIKDSECFLHWKKKKIKEK